MAAPPLIGALGQLRDIHPPPPPAAWPPAPGWWIVYSVAVALLAVLGALLWRRRQRRAPYRQALRELDTIRANLHRDDRSVAAIAQLLRRVVVVRDPAAAALPLEHALQRCAAARGPAHELARLLAGRFSAAPCDAAAVQRAAEQWLKQAAGR